MNPAELVRLTPLMERTEGKPEIAVAIIDGPVSLDQPAFSGQRIQQVRTGSPAACKNLGSVACSHGTFVTAILAAKRGSGAPAICPGCSFLVRPIFSESPPRYGDDPSATPEELATAIADAVQLGARVINLSAALVQPSSRGRFPLSEAFDYAARRGAIVVAAAGNQPTVGSSAITRHPWVVPVVACDHRGIPTVHSNFGSSIGKQGLCAPGESVTSLGVTGKPETFGGTSAAAPFVTGGIALLWSEFPAASASEIRLAIGGSQPRISVVPPLMNAWAAYQAIAFAQNRRKAS